MHPDSIGPFRIERELGRGGMGEVFLARDTRLDRQVAIKALPAHLAQDPDRLARFQREAKVLASLNHPGIAAIYGLEEVNGHQYLILEYVDGETLGDRLARGPIGVDEAIPLAKQIAEALEVAHEKGVIHRDLKPGNVMVTPEGVVKVLDFGLARTAEGAAHSSSVSVPSDSPTVTSPARFANSPTVPGVIMGTAGYMSPEQARGKPVDKRSDIFSFGCVFYEMLTGSMPFQGETVADAIGATLHKEFDCGLLPPTTPRRVRDLLNNCLAKDRKSRLQDIGDARLELDRALSGRDADEQAGAKRSVPLRAAALLLTATFSAAGTWVIATRRAPTPTTDAGPGLHLVIPSRTEAYRAARRSAIAPDGRSVAFVAQDVARDEPSLWVRPLDSFEARPIPETDGASGIFWSPDSRSLAFHAGGKLWAVDVAGGSRRLLAAVPGNYGAHWTSGGFILLTPIGGPSHVLKIATTGGTVEQLTTLDPASTEKVHVWPRLLPDGEHFLYVGVDFDPKSEVRVGRLYAARLGSDERRVVGNIISQAWYVEPGRLVYVEDGTIKSAPFDVRSLQMTGEAATVADSTAFFKEYGWSSLSVADNGTIAFEPPEGEERLVWYDFDGKRLGTLGSKGSYQRIRFSPDGSQIAVALQDRRMGTLDLWLYGTERQTATHLTTDAREESTPVWAPDGTSIYFSWDQSEAPRVYSMRSDGTGGIQEVYGENSGGGVWFADDVSPDGTVLIVNGTIPKLGREARAVPLGSKGEAVTIMSSPGNESMARFSPKGDYLALVSTISGRTEVYITPFPGPGPRTQISEGGGWNPVWSQAGDRLYYLKDNGVDPARQAGFSRSIMAVDLPDAAAFKSPPAPRVLFESADAINEFDVARDGKRLLAIVQSSDTPPIRVIQNTHAPRSTAAQSR